jgi:hypothetical protein
MAHVGAIYSQARFPRTAADVIDEVCRRRRAKDRPPPQHKHVWAQMTRIAEGKVWLAAPLLFLSMMMECHLRNPAGKKLLICIMDGERQLWKLAKDWFPRAVGILDLFHALKRLRPRGALPVCSKEPGGGRVCEPSSAYAPGGQGPLRLA